MTITDWLDFSKAMGPVVAALVVVSGGALAYRRQKNIDRYEELVRKRREIYAEYVVTLQRNIMGQVDPVAYQSAMASIYIYGADDVVRKVAEFHNEVGDKAGSIDGPRASNLYAKMVAAMRADSFERSKLSVDQLQTLAPFKY